MTFILLLFFVYFIQAQPVLLRTVDTLVFKDGFNTIPGRTKSVPQLVCISGNACGTVKQPRSVSCKNIGTDYATGEPNWACTAMLEGVKFGQTDVSCEGYAHKDDMNVLIGSCNLEYTLFYLHPHHVYDFSNDWLIMIVFILLFFMVVFVVFAAKSTPNVIPVATYQNPQEYTYMRAPYYTFSRCDIPMANEVPIQVTRQKEVPTQTTSFGTTTRRQEEVPTQTTSFGTTTRRQEEVPIEVTRREEEPSCDTTTYIQTPYYPIFGRDIPVATDVPVQATSFGTTTRRQEVTSCGNTTRREKSPNLSTSFGTTKRRD
jgi:hypothetical protein